MEELNINNYFPYNMSIQFNIKFLAAYIIGCFFLYSCENDIKAIKELDAKKVGVEEAKMVVVNYSLGGKKKAILVSPLMFRVQEAVPYIEFPKTIHVDFFDAAGMIESKLDARYANYKENESKVFLKDSVRVINNKGDTLYCNELNWDLKKTGTEFYTDKPVRIRTRTQIFDGIGMDAKQDFSDWHIIKIVGFLKVPASQFPN